MEATVEVLTAEVRTLMVGSRQVTLSVYRQLDWVSPSKIEPFGRVHANKSVEPGALEVVGRAVDTGVLVRSDIERPSGGSITVSAGKWCEVGGYRFPDVVEVLGARVRVHQWSVLPSTEVEAGLWRFSSPEAKQAVEEQVIEELGWRAADLRLYETFKALPLIVLAGLK